MWLVLDFRGGQRKMIEMQREFLRILLIENAPGAALNWSDVMAEVKVITKEMRFNFTSSLVRSHYHYALSLSHKITME